MEKIKSFLSTFWYILASIVGIIVLILTLGMISKNKKIADLISKLSTANTKAEVNEIEKQIVEISTKKDMNSQELEELNGALDALAQKRKELEAQEKDKTTQEVEDFWNKK